MRSRKEEGERELHLQKPLKQETVCCVSGAESRPR